MDDIRIHVPAIPVAQPRPRAARFGGKLMMIGNPTKHPVTAFKATCRMAAEQAYSGPPLEGPLALSIVCCMPRPGNMIWKKRPMPRVPHAKRPDFDNLAKSCVDALTGILWRDDAQLYEVRVVKVIAAFDEAPHVELTLWKGE